MDDHIFLSIDISTASTELKTELNHFLKQEFQLLGTPEEIQEVKKTSQLPAGAMAGEAFTLGQALLLAVLPVLLPKLAEIIRDFKLRNNHHQLKINIKKGQKEITVEMPAGVKPEEIEAYTAVLSKSLD